METLKQTYFQGYPESAGCVQGSIDSRNSAIHSAYRISLRPSSLFEPRHPSLKVVNVNSRHRRGRKRVSERLEGVASSEVIGGRDKPGRRPRLLPPPWMFSQGELNLLA